MADATENRFLNLERKYNEIQTALNNLATKLQSKSLLNIRQAEIEWLKEQVDSIVTTDGTVLNITQLSNTLNDIQTALNNLVTKTQMKSLVNIRQAEIEWLKDMVGQLSIVDPTILVASHNTSTSAHSNQFTSYFLRDEFIDIAAGAIDAGKPVKLNADGLIDDSMISLSAEDHGILAGLSDDDHLQYILVNGLRGFTNTVSGIEPVSNNDLSTKKYVDDAIAGFSSDHGTLTGLEDDDHSAYVPRNGSRGFTSTVSGITPIATNDLATKDYVDDSIAGFSTSHSDLTDLNADDHTQYLTSGRADTWLTNKSIDNLLDVSVPTPNSGDHLVWFGTQWISSQPTSVVGSSPSFYLDVTHSLADNFTLSNVPSTYAETINAKACTTATSPVFFERFASGPLARSTIPAGTWSFQIYAGASAITGSNTIKFRINKRVAQTGMTGTFTGSGPTRTFTVSGGTPFVPGDANASRLLAGLIETPTQTAWISGYTSSSVVTVTLTDAAFVNVAGATLNAIYYFLFNDTTPELDQTAVKLYTVNSVQPAFTGLNDTDRLVIALFGVTNGNRTLSLYYGGTAHFTHFDSTIITAHNDLAGLNDGDYKHLTSGEYTNLTDSGDTTLHKHDIYLLADGTRALTSGLNWGGFTAAYPMLQRNVTSGLNLKYADDSNWAPFSVGEIDLHGQLGGPTPLTSTPSGTSQLINWNNGNFQIVNLGSTSENVTLVFANPRAGASYILEIIQHASSPRTVTWPSTVKWPDSIAPVISVGASAIDVVSLAYNGTIYIGSCGQNYG